MEEKIDIDGKDGKDEAMQSKIEAFCSTLMKIPGFPIWTMVSE